MGKTIVLFDVDGTLTAPRRVVDPKMTEFLNDLKERVDVGVVGGSDLKKIMEQLGGDHMVNEFKYLFSENGLLAFKEGKQIGEASILDHLGEAGLRKVVDFALKYIADLDIPKKRGTFVEYRKGMLNISPIGRNCSIEEREEFYAWDMDTKVREKMVSAIREHCADLNLTFSIGGQISFDVFPQGWDKRYCLQFLGDYDTIHFFGDKTFKGGNDHEIFEDPKTIGHTVTSWEDTIEQVSKIFGM
eukprot:Clim_evm3s143 gene=Clim_evmTU3s143